jgi:hypothetical protein
MADRYRSVWAEFVRLAQAEHVIVPRSQEPSTVAIADTSTPSSTSTACSYSATRLLFRRDRIDPLGWDDAFEVRTPDGIFRMTKRQFYDTFHGVTETNSYRIKGLYHYPKTPRRALPFRLADS